jgi:hypothetical protein
MRAFPIPDPEVTMAAKPPSLDRLEEFAKATAEAKAAFDAQLAKTERLRALRLEHEAAANAAAKSSVAQPAQAKAKARKRRARS